MEITIERIKLISEVISLITTVISFFIIIIPLIKFTSSSNDHQKEIIPFLKQLLRKNKVIIFILITCILIASILSQIEITTDTFPPSDITLTTTYTPKPISTDTISITNTPSTTPFPLCNNQISITRPLNNEKTTAFRQQTGNLYWFKAEGEVSLCPVGEVETQWSIIFISEMDSPKCILVKQIILDADNTKEWQASIPIANTTILPEGDISPPINVTLSAYLVPAQSVNSLSDASYCRHSIDDYELSNELLEQAISDQLTIQLIKTSK